MHRLLKFDIAHHVTWGSIQQGSFLYKLGIPFIFGPAGGGQASPPEFKKYFDSYWNEEIKREKISKLLQTFNPGCRRMIKRSKVILATNQDTFSLAKKLGAKNVKHVFDAALPKTFFPEKAPDISLEGEGLKLLWIGRFLPRKGILLVLEVMEQLKKHPKITLTVVGDGEMKELFLDAINRFELHDTVTWTGRIPFSEVKSYYQNHDAFFFTSLRDSSPAQLIEAMAFGLPVITLDLHGQSLMVNSTRGFKASVDNPSKTIKELVNFLTSLSQNRKLLQELSKESYTFALEQTWDKKVKKLISEHYTKSNV